MSAEAGVVPSASAPKMPRRAVRSPLSATSAACRRRRRCSLHHVHIRIIALRGVPPLADILRRCQQVAWFAAHHHFGIHQVEREHIAKKHECTLA